MDVEAAFQELGIGRDVTPELAHRAYVKLVKQRRPEDDPAGFQRLREAYEMVRAAVTSSVDSRAQSAAALRPADERMRAYAEAAAIEGPGEWRAVERALALAASAGGGPEPPLLVAVETIAVLLATGATADAIALDKALGAYLAVVGETRALTGDLAVRASTVRDLVAMAAVLPPGMAAEMAKGFVQGTMEEAVRAVRVFVRAEPEKAAAARRVCQTLKSPVSRLFGPHFARVELTKRPRRIPAAEPARGFIILRWVVIGALALIGLWVLIPWR